MRIGSKHKAPSYSGLVRRPLTAVTRVRIPLGSPERKPPLRRGFSPFLRASVSKRYAAFGNRLATSDCSAARSSAVATPSRSSSNRSAYTSRVTAARCRCGCRRTRERRSRVLRSVHGAGGRGTRGWGCFGACSPSAARSVGIPCRRRRSVRRSGAGVSHRGRGRRPADPTARPSAAT